MNYTLLPDLIAMAALLAIMSGLLRRYPKPRLSAWLIGLSMVFLEGLFHAFYHRGGNYERPLHAFSLDCYFIASAAFLLSVTDEVRLDWRRYLYIGINFVPHVAMATLYGYRLRDPDLFLWIIACGPVMGILAGLILKRYQTNPFLLLLNYAPLLVYAWHGDLRSVIYCDLFFLYAKCGIGFYRRLPRSSHGKFAIVLGFICWSGIFITHPALSDMPNYSVIASNVWDMQKFVITIGMLLVMLEDEIREKHMLALYDSLTGLANRRLFEERLAQALESSDRNRTVGVIAIDLNGFKAINDSMGHEAGDVLLREVSRRMLMATRSKEEGFTRDLGFGRKADLLARVGGDEFCIIAQDPQDMRQMILIAERLAEAINQPVEVLPGTSVTISGSLGLAIYPAEASTSSELLALADRRMYEYKRTHQREAEAASTAATAKAALAAARPSVVAIRSQVPHGTAHVTGLSADCS